MTAIMVYFSRAGENYFSGSIKNIEKGNTEILAEKIAEKKGADIFKLEALVPYSESYNECIKEAKDDQRRNARPELRAYPENLESYDEIYLGYPNYWGTMPMVLFTFLEHFDFSGKTIHPFCSHEGSGLGRSEEDIKRLCPKALLKEGLAIKGSNVENSDEEIDNWLNKK